MELGWIDFSKTERSKILSVLDLLSESGTLDELGIAPVRDGFSNLFFPGTTTIQTRAKYFFIVPYALKQLERSSETNPNRVFKALDAIEKSCGQIFLEQNSSENGIIGKRSLQSGGWVKRTPADIYWAGMKRYGIFTGGGLSLSEYIRISCAMKDKKTTLKKLGNRNDSAEENECDDKNAGDLFKMQFWKMPLYSDKWMENLSINLTKAEAEFLQEQIIENCKGSLLACVLEMGITEFLDCESFRDLGAIIDKFPEAVQQDYWLALAFSDLLKSKNRYLNMTKLSEELFNGSEDNPSNPFQEVFLTSEIVVDEEEEKQNLLDGYIKEINRLKPTARVIPNGEYFDLSVCFTEVIETEYKVSISPLLSNKTEQRQ